METYNGHVRTPTDAIILFEACRLGLLPRVQRRLSEKERQLIRSGSVFVWDEREAGMRRWTDGKSWSASRVSGSFLTYREMEGKRGGNNTAATSLANGRTPESARNSADEATQTQQLDPEEGPDGYRYKPDGLMKQSFSITTSQGQHLHLISYYARSHPTAPGLRQPSNDPNLSQIQPAKGMYPETTVNDQSSVPAVTQSPMAGAPNYAMAPQSPYVRQGPGATHPQGYMMPGYPSYMGYPQSQPGQPPPGYAHVPYPPHAGLPPPGYHSVPPYGYPQHTPFSQPPPAFDQRPIHNPDSSRPPSQQLPPALRPPVPSSQPNGTYSTSQPPLQSYQQPPYARPPPVSKAEKSPAPAIQIDPRLMGGPAQQEAPLANGNTRDALATERRRENGSVQVTASQAPTIGALVNSASPMSNQNGMNDPRDRQGSTSPGGTKKSAPQMQDIPSEKLGFREDSRALRQLDKVFAA